MRSDAQYKRDQLIELANEKYVIHLSSCLLVRSNAHIKTSRWSDSKAKTAAYLTWPDARLRAYLRERGISEAALPTSRPGLLREYPFFQYRRCKHELINHTEETRIRWVESHQHAETIFQKIKELVNSGLYKAEDVISHIMSLLKGDLDSVTHHAGSAYDATKHKAEEGVNKVKERAGSAEGWTGEKVEAAGDKVKASGQKLQGEL